MFSFMEFFDIVVMTFAVGFIFSSMFRKLGFDGNAFWFACLVTAPALIFHEFAHKFVALSFGLDATFHAAYIWLAIGVVLSLMRFGFIFFVPAYVSITGSLTPLASSLVAFAGPFANLVLFAVASLFLQKHHLKKNTYVFLQVTKQINLFLFIFNMLPIPMFDGWTVYSGIFHLFF